MSDIRIGLLPLYLKLYDKTLPSLRRDLKPFLQSVTAAFEAAGVMVTAAGPCCVRAEVEDAVRRFDAEHADLIVTLHMAYSPSLEVVDTLAAARRPILLLDTTPDHAFGRDVDPVLLLRNHGIHGVQDLAAVLRRRKTPYWIVAGHLSDPRLVERVCGIARAARAARELRAARVLRIGPPFAGMGDFQVEEEVLRRTLGIHADSIEPAALGDAVAAVSEEDVAAEMAHDRDAFEVSAPDEVHRRSTRVGLGLRRHLEAGGYNAFSVNFLAFDSAEEPVSTIPFLECSKAMARGVGYAGEGDVLTAALVGALQRAFGGVTFTEMFCPDWDGGSVFLSHMGECNPGLAAARPLLYEKDFPFTAALNPACLACAPRPGPATIVNLAPGPDDSFTLIAAPVTILEDGTHPAITQWIRAWVRPAVPLPAFLEAYSRLGGTHHCALVLGDHREGLLAFASMAGLDGRLIAEA